MINPQSLPRLKQEDATAAAKDISLKSIIQHSLSNVSLDPQAAQDAAAVPRSIAGSIHKKKEFDTYRPKPPAETMMYSKSDLLRMILENDNQGTTNHSTILDTTTAAN